MAQRVRQMEGLVLDLIQRRSCLWSASPCRSLTRDEKSRAVKDASGSACHRAIHRARADWRRVVFKGNTHTNWIFPNVLCQIGLGYFFAWCLMNLRWFVQIISLIVLLAGYWAAFYFNPPPADYNYEAVNASGEEIFQGSWSAWSKNANTAYQFDAWLLPKLRTPLLKHLPLPQTIPATSWLNGSLPRWPRRMFPLCQLTKKQPHRNPGLQQRLSHLKFRGQTNQPRRQHPNLQRRR